MKINIKKISSVIILIILGIILMLTGSYAYNQLLIRGQDSKIDGKSSSFFDILNSQDTITITPVEGFNLKLETPEYINAADLIPIKDNQIDDKAIKTYFRVTNEDQTDSYLLNILISEIDITNNLKVEDLSWSLNEYSNNKEISAGTFKDVNSEIIMIENLTLKNLSAKEYVLKIWLSETSEDQSYLLNGTLKSKLKIEAYKVN